MNANPQFLDAKHLAQERQLDTLYNNTKDLDNVALSIESASEESYHEARSMEFKKTKVGMHILNLGMDTQTPTGKLMLTVLGGVAQFEREIMLERQREGVAKAKAAGKYKGRQPISSERRQEVRRMATEGVSKASIARQVGVGEATVYRILKATP